MKQARGTLSRIYEKLFNHFGPQHWWPGETRFEIMVGAILTQNTNWGNVARAISNLKDAGVLTPKKLHSLPVRRLAQLIRPSGYFNIKARRLKNFLDFLFSEYGGSLTRVGQTPLPRLRAQLLEVNGIGPETADSILLYAFDKPIFVTDAYTRRFLSRHRLIKKDAGYDEIQKFFMVRRASFIHHRLARRTTPSELGEARGHLKSDVSLFNEYHALIVRLGKDFCRPRPRCELCPLRGMLGKPKLKQRHRSQDTRHMSWRPNQILNFFKNL